MARRLRAPRLLALWSTTVGRWLRIYAGSLLVVLGIASGDVAGWILAVPGVGLLLGGAGDVSLLAALLGGPFAGEALRERLGLPREAPLTGRFSLP